jgi:hypothetical protein
MKNLVKINHEAIKIQELVNQSQGEKDLFEKAKIHHKLKCSMKRIIGLCAVAL